MTRSRRRWVDGTDDPGMTPKKLEAILRHFLEFKELWVLTGDPSFDLPGGITFNVIDLERLIHELPRQQRTALTLTVIYNHTQSDAARLMGVGGPSPVGAYTQIALRKLVDWYWTDDEEADGPGEEGARAPG